MNKIKKYLKLKSSEAGFTILEVMIGLVIFTLGLLLLLSMMIISIDGNMWSENHTQSMQLIREKIEQLKNTDEALMVSGNDAIGSYSRNWTVVQATPELKAVSVKVSWLEPSGDSKACSTVTMIYPK